LLLNFGLIEADKPEPLTLALQTASSPSVKPPLLQNNPNTIPNISMALNIQELNKPTPLGINIPKGYVYRVFSPVDYFTERG
jgi:hypothetical protein